jgi:hypothetical protein
VVLAELSKIKIKIAVHHDDLSPRQWGIKQYRNRIGIVSTGRDDFLKILAVGRKPIQHPLKGTRFLDGKSRDGIQIFLACGLASRAWIR